MSLLRPFLFLPFPISFYYGRSGYNYQVRVPSLRMKRFEASLGPWCCREIFVCCVRRTLFFCRCQVREHRSFSRDLVRFGRILGVGLFGGLMLSLDVVDRRLGRGPFLFCKILIFTHFQFYNWELHSQYFSCFYDIHRVLVPFFYVF